MTGNQPKHLQQELRLAQEALKPSLGLDRRSFLVSAAAGSAAIFGSTHASAQQLVANAMPYVDRVPGSARAQANRKRSTFAKDLGQLVDLNATNQGGAYWNYRTYITPIEKFYIRNEYGTPRAESDPRVDRRHWKLTIHGDGIKRPLTIDYEDLLRMPSRSIVATMECAGNGRSLFWEQQDMTAVPQQVTGSGWGLGGIGQAEWQYVPMSHILSLVELKRDAKAALFWSGVDNKGDIAGGVGDRGRPLPVRDLKSYADYIGLAFKMNGQDLPADHGGPVRALVPGYCGAASTKWITEIKISRNNFWVPLNSTAHVMMGPSYPPPKPSPDDEFRFITADNILGPGVTWSRPKSLITVPLVLEKQPQLPSNYPLKAGQWPVLSAGPQTVNGYAWAPRYGVDSVEYRINGGDWEDAEIIQPNLGRFTWVRFNFPWNPSPGRHVIETRVTDNNGAEQPETVPYNKGGFDFWAVPKFKIEVV